MTDGELVEIAMSKNVDINGFVIGFRYAESLQESKVSNWRNDFDVYLLGLTKVYSTLVLDPDYIQQQEKFNPNIDIKLSLEKAVTNFWGTEAGWKYKKKQKSKDIDWKATLTNAISLNKVWKPKDPFNFNKPVTNQSYLR
jgi:hypothetical protein